MTEQSFDAVIALGSNIGDKVANIEHAVALLTQTNLVRLVRHSRIFKTPPWGNTDQDWFVNSCASVKTSLNAHQLLRHCLNVEKQMGRERKEKWGPRIIDLDILVYRDVSLDDDELTLPHPHITERAFVLAPMADVAPDMIIKGQSVLAWLAAVDRTGVEPLIAVDPKNPAP